MARLGELEPLPTGAYTSTMSAWDLYPNNIGLSGATTQDRSLPAYGAMTEAAARPGAAIEHGLVGTPAGWYALGLLALAVLAWTYGKG